MKHFNAIVSIISFVENIERTISCTVKISLTSGAGVARHPAFGPPTPPRWADRPSPPLAELRKEGGIMCVEASLLGASESRERGDKEPVKSSARRGCEAPR